MTGPPVGHFLGLPWKYLARPAGWTCCWGHSLFIPVSRAFTRRLVAFGAAHGRRRRADGRLLDHRGGADRRHGAIAAGAVSALLGIAASKQTALAYGNHVLFFYRRLSDCRRFAEVEPASAHRAVDYSVDRCRSLADYDGFYAGDGFFVDVDIEYRDDADDVAGGSGGGGGVGAK